MKQQLKYGVNPHQGAAYLSSEVDALTTLNGNPGYINFLDALTAWQLVAELAASTGKAAAGSKKKESRK